METKRNYTAARLETRGAQNRPVSFPSSHFKDRFNHRLKRTMNESNVPTKTASKATTAEHQLNVATR